MSVQTPNYQLIKPTYTETADIDIINTNMDIVDTKMKEIEDKAEALDTALDTKAAVSDLCAHLAEKASQAQLGHVKVDGNTITADTNGTLILGGFGLRGVTHLYVNATNGNDGNNGLYQTSAFKTIEAAVAKYPTANNLVLNLSNETHVISGGLIINRKNLVFNGYDGWTNTCKVQVTNNNYIMVDDSFISAYGMSFVFKRYLFSCRGNCSFMMGGYESVIFKPYDNSAGSVFYGSNIYARDQYAGVAMITVAMNRVGFDTTNVAGYSSVFNVFESNTSYVKPVMLMTLNSVSKDSKTTWHNGSDTLSNVGSVYII